jgi:hypothetical protein
MRGRRRATGRDKGREKEEKEVEVEVEVEQQTEFPLGGFFSNIPLPLSPPLQATPASLLAHLC